MLIAPRVSEPMESDVPPAFHAPTGHMSETEAVHEHHHPAMTTYNTTVKMTSSVGRPKSPVYIHRCPFQNCTHGRRFLQPVASAAQTCEDHMNCQDYLTQLQESTGAYTPVSRDSHHHASCQDYEDGLEEAALPRGMVQGGSYGAYSDGTIVIGRDSPSLPYEGAAAESLTDSDQWYVGPDLGYIPTQDSYNPKYTTEDMSPRLVSRGLSPISHLQDINCMEDPSAVSQSHRTRSATSPRIPKVSMGYRQRAIDCMLRQLRVSSDSSDPSTIQVIKQNVTQLEDQLYHHAQTKDEYQLLVARKLYTILQQLEERQQRSTSPVRYQGASPTLRT